MSDVSSPVPEDDPLMVAWLKYRQSAKYANTEYWARSPKHTAGSLWAAFEAGYRAGRLRELIYRMCDECGGMGNGGEVTTAQVVDGFAPDDGPCPKCHGTGRLRRIDPVRG